MNLKSFTALFRKTTPLTSYAFLSNDMHSHILPGIDDGAQDVTTSMELIEGLAELGFTGFCATPHVIADRYPNTPASIKGALERAQAELRKRNVNVTLTAAAEYLVDQDFANLLAGRKMQTIGQDHLLIEMPFIAPAPRIEDHIFNIQVAGLRPIMAHPERYRYWNERLAEWDRIHKLGCELQVNLLSLFGHYGKEAKKQAFKLIEADLVAYLGTDIHRVEQLKILKNGLSDRSVARLLEGRTFKNASLKL